MKILWQGTDITGYVIVHKALARDTCGGRCDGMDIEFENPESWKRWDPAKDDKIVVEADGWESGTLYLNTIAPGNRNYRVIATALPCSAREKEWKSYEKKTINTILMECAAATGMSSRVYGISDAEIPYIQQENESAAAFLHRLATLEGAKLKCVNGRYTLIGLEWAQDRQAIATMTLAANRDGVEYRKSGAAIKKLTVVTHYAEGTATDANAGSTGLEMTVTEAPATQDIQAARWARNLLMDKNRACESVTLETRFNASLTAMTRLDINGGTNADGEWIVDEVEHDLINRHSRALLRRCIRSVR